MGIRDDAGQPDREFEKGLAGARRAGAGNVTDNLEKQIWEALRKVTFPGMSRDIVSFGFVRSVDCSGPQPKVQLAVPTHNPGSGDRIKVEVDRALEGFGDVDVSLEVVVPKQAQAHRGTARDSALLSDVRRIVAVASGKGGVGKSTVSVNLALALASQGHRVGLLDADIYGPSIPMMLGIQQKPRVEDGRIVPFEKYGIRLMSLGFVLDIDTPVIWRGPMVIKALEQLMGDVDWGELDYMIVDLPPGTGDAQLTLAQKVPLAGGVIVSTPQDVALIDARKGLAMFRKVNVPVLGLVENMSTFVCPKCGERTDIFKHGGGKRTAETLRCRFLGSVPLDPQIALGGDSGVPAMATEDAVHAEAFLEIARGVTEELERSTPERRPLTIV